MKNSVLLVFVAWRLTVVLPFTEIQSLYTDPDAISNIRLLVPLSVNERIQQHRIQAENDLKRKDQASAEYEQESNDKVPAKDEQECKDEASAEYEQERNDKARAKYEKKRIDQSRAKYEQERNDRASAKYEQERNDQASAKYEQKREQEWDSSENDEVKDVWHACVQLARTRNDTVREVLLALCAELLDAAGPRELCACPCHDKANQPIADDVKI